MIQIGKNFRTMFRYSAYTLVAFCVVVPIRFFIAQPFIVSGTSMEPTINRGEYIVIDELTYRNSEPQRGDVIIFRYPLDPSIYFVKRIIGLPGETVKIQEGRVHIVAAGTTTSVAISEPYRIPEKNEKKDSSVTTLDRNEYFVMGDNRDASADSRVWGPLQKRFIIGRAFARLYPFDRVGLFPGRFTF